MRAGSLSLALVLFACGQPEVPSPSNPPATPTHRPDSKADPVPGTPAASYSLSLDTPSNAHPLAPGTLHRHHLALAAGTFVDLQVEQLGVDVALELLDPQGRTLLAVDSPTDALGFEWLQAISTLDGEHHLEIRAFEDQPPGAYRVELIALRTAGPRDRAHAAAARAFAAGEMASFRDREAHYRSALGLYLKAGDPVGEAECHDRLGELARATQGCRKAIEHRQRAAKLFRDAGLPRREAWNLDNLGRCERIFGRYREARQLIRRALELWKAAEDPLGEAIAYHDLGLIAADLGETQDALDSYQRALDRWRAHDPSRAAETLHALGALDLARGRARRARDHLSEAREIYLGLGKERQLAAALDQLGLVHRELGELELAAKALAQALELRHRAGAPRGEAITLANLAIVERKRGASQRARALNERALEIFVAADDKRSAAQVRANLGFAALASGRPSEAIGLLGQALETFRLIKATPDIASTLGHLAAATARVGELESARQHLENAIELDEELRNNARSPERRADHFADLIDHHVAYIDLLMELHQQDPQAGHDAAALAVSERKRARVLLDLVDRTNHLRAESADRHAPARAEHRRALQDELAMVERRLTAGRLGDPLSAAQAAALERRLRDLTEALSELRAAIPTERAPRGGEPLNVEDLRREVLDPETALLEIALGERRSHAWVLTQHQLMSTTLPSEKEIEAAAHQAHTMMSRSHRPESATAAQTAICELAELLMPAFESFLPFPKLSRDQLPENIEAPGIRRLLVVADGALQMIPFAALPTPNVPCRPRESELAHDATEPTALVDLFEVVQAPSASLIAALRDERGPRPPDLRVAVVADPVLTHSDPRLPLAARQREASSQHGSPRRPELIPLRYSQREAHSILEHFDALALLGFDAQREALLGGVLHGHRIVHFATHALLDPKHPALSSIALSQWDATGEPRNGWIFAHEIGQLNLDAELVVLSACRTALGRAMRGEGLVGLTREFFDAGARQVVASLWDVADEATTELMQRFYAHLAQGTPVPTALRRAQLELRATARWQAPSHWAAFVAEGDWQLHPN